MTDAISLLTRHNVIIHRDRRLATRSAGLMRFVGYLWWKRHNHPKASWVTTEELARVLDRPGPKQMQRYVDAMESACLPLIEYRSKTRGAWRLSVASHRMHVDREGDEFLAWLGFDPARMPDSDPASAVSPPMGELAVNLSNVLMADALFAEHGLDEGEARSAQATYRALLDTPGATMPMKAGVMQRLCLLHRLRNDFDAWEHGLAEMEALLNDGELLGADFSARMRLSRFFLRYDEGRIQESLYLLERIDPAQISDAFTLGRYWNAMGMAVLHMLRQEQEPPGGASCAQAGSRLNACLGHFRQALGYALTVNDYAGLEGMCFNIGNALQEAVRLAPGEEDDLRLQEATRWIGLCEMVCYRFGVGGSSQWSRLVLADMALRQGWSFGEMNRLAGGIYGRFGDLEHMLKDTLAHSAGCANRLEQAECCRLLAKLHRQCSEDSRAARYFEDAMVIYRDLGRKDKISAMLLSLSNDSRISRGDGE